MKKSDFLILCKFYLVDPSIAIENESVREAIESDNLMLLNELLESEF